MDCPSEKTFQAYLQGELADDQRDALEEHIDGCARCGEVLGRMTSADENRTSKPKGLVDPSEVAGLDPDVAQQMEAAGYAVVEKIGAGGFGIVFRAREIVAARDVAVKYLPRGLLSREVETLAKIDHVGIVKLFTAHRLQNGQGYFVMPYMRGGSLRVLIEKAPDGVDPTRTARIMRAVADAVDYMHRGTERQALIHRDLKPENILLDENDNPHIADFGLAAAAAELHEHPASVGGTVPYASPEQVHGLQGQPVPVDSRSDIWSLGVILYELLTGKQPFIGSEEKIMELIIKCEHMAPTDLNTDIPKKLHEITQKCLRKNPEERFQSAEDLASALRDFIGGQVDDKPQLPERGDTTHFSIPTGVNCLIFSPDGKLLVAGDEEGNVRFRTLNPEKKWRDLPVIHQKSVKCLAFSPDGKILASGSHDHRIHLWDMESDAGVAFRGTLEGHRNTVMSLCFTPGGYRLGSAGFDGIKFWDWNKGVVESVIQEDPKQAGWSRERLRDKPLWTHIAFSSDGKRIVAADKGGNLYIWRTTSENLHLQAVIKAHDQRITSLTFQADGRILASTSSDKTIKLWDVTTGKQIGKPFDKLEREGTSVAFSRDMKLLASAGKDRWVRIFDVSTSGLRQLAVKDAVMSIRSVAFSPCHDIVAYATAKPKWSEAEVCLWNVSP